MVQQMKKKKKKIVQTNEKWMMLVKGFDIGDIGNGNGSKNG